MILEVLKYILVVLGIIAVGAFIIWGLVSLILVIIEPHGNQKGSNVEQQPTSDRQITYEPQKLISAEPTYEPYVAEQVNDIDEQKALEEERALENATSADELSNEEDEFIKLKQKQVEERIASKNKVEDELDLDSIFVDDEETNEEEAVESAEDEDIEELINKILSGEQEETEETEEVEEAEEVSEEAEEEVVEETNQDNQRVQELEEELARQKQEFEEKLKLAEEAKANDEANANRIAELEKVLAEKEEQVRLDEEAKAARIAELERVLAEKEEQAKLAEEKLNERTGATLSLEEYEARLETLKERLKANEKDFKAVKKEYIPLAKIKARLEKDNTKLRRKEALVAKQKVVLYGVNNYVDIDEEKAKKLAEDLDLLEGLRLSVQHCEEVMKANEERYPILETSYNSLLETNNNLKADIEDVTNKIAELKANSEN